MPQSEKGEWSETWATYSVLGLGNKKGGTTLPGPNKAA